jgi:hypothetical protein
MGKPQKAHAGATHPDCALALSVRHVCLLGAAVEDVVTSLKSDRS